MLFMRVVVWVWKVLATAKPKLFRPRASHARRNARPTLEVLEGRIVPATLYWNGATGNGRMSDPNNYTPTGGLPMPALQAGDTIIFDGLQGPFSNAPAIADQAMPANIASIQIMPTYKGTLDIATNLTVDNFSVATQTVTINGGNTLTVEQAGLTGGTLTGGGSRAAT